MDANQRLPKFLPMPSTQRQRRRQRQEIRSAIARSDTSELTQAMERAYATTFTAEELAFLADYAHSEVGKRVQAKMSVYVGKVGLIYDRY